jgi:serine/threonine-protein kinase
VEGEYHGIVMELLEGENVLDVVTNEGKMEPEDALRIVRQAAAGLEAAHAKGIVHRDVKPQNLVILEDGTVKLVDFGLATDTDADGPEASSGRVGTPHYMAPEVCEAKLGGPPSDVYSLGISLYHLVVGQPPHAGKGLKEILAGHIEAKPLAPEKQVRELTTALGDLVRGMTKRDPLTRLTLGEVIEKVDHLGGEALKKDLKVHRRRRSRHAGASSTARGKGAPVALIVIGVLVVVVLGIVLSQKTPPRPTPPAPPPTPEAVDPEPRPATPPVVGPGTPAGMDEPTPPPTPPVETEAERKAREDKEAAEKKAEKEARARQAVAAWNDAVDFARRNEGDKNSVIQSYRVMFRSFPDSPQGKEAKKRADLIEKGEMHPHPDKTFAPPTVVDEARVAWEAKRAQPESLVAGHLYAEALALVPPPRRPLRQASGGRRVPPQAGEGPGRVPRLPRHRGERDEGARAHGLDAQGRRQGHDREAHGPPGQRRRQGPRAPVDRACRRRSPTSASARSWARTSSTSRPRRVRLRAQAARRVLLGRDLRQDRRSLSGSTSGLVEKMLARAGALRQ